MLQKLSELGKQNYMRKLTLLESEAHHMLTPWQRKFISDVYERFLIKPMLSKKQMDQIDSIYEKIMDDLDP